MEYQCLVEQKDEKEEDAKDAGDSMPELVTEPEDEKEDHAEKNQELDRISVTVDDWISEPESSKKSEPRVRRTSSDMDVDESTEEDNIESENMPELSMAADGAEPAPSADIGRSRKKVIINLV